jgi:hypothetical protein
MPKYSNRAEIAAIVEGFESCCTDKDAFKHQDHLVVAVFYLQERNVADATTRMKHNLLRFLDHHQVDRQKYNETITVFWFEWVADVLKKLHSAASLVDKCNKVVESLDNSALVFEYYSRERLFSSEARETFIRPDLKEWS